MPNSNPFRLDGQVAVITGAGSGIGRSMAELFAASGAIVHVLDLDEQAALETVARIKNKEGQAFAHACDVALQASVIGLLDHIQRQTPMTILVNNAGIGFVGNLEQTTEADMDRLFRVNVKGVYNDAQYDHECCLTGGIKYI